VFPRARTLAWIAVVLLVADVIVEVLRNRNAPAASGAPGGPAPKTEPDEQPAPS
jgi:hypothetical protein